MTADVQNHSYSWKSQIASSFLFKTKTLRKKQSRMPPNGFISSFLVLLTTIGILTILNGAKCHHILSSDQQALLLPVSEGVAMSIFTPSKGVSNSISLLSVGDLEQDMQLPISSFQGFTTSFADGKSEKLNTQVHFDTDSIFFVCINSTTGHICNDIQKFIPGSLCQTNKCLTTANSTGSCHQEGTVQLQLLDDNGTNYIFILDNCLYHPGSPVNLLLTRRLAEKYIDVSRNSVKQT